MYAGSPLFQAEEGSMRSSCVSVAINYRLAPEVRFPEPLLDVVYGYLRLVEDLRIQPKNIVSPGCR